MSTAGHDRSAAQEVPRAESRAPAPAQAPPKAPLAYRLVTGGRLALLSAAAIVLTGVADHFLSLVILTASLGPTAYLLLAHPEAQSARWRNAVVGHSTAIAAGLGSLWLFGLFRIQDHPHIGKLTLTRAGAVGVAVGLTMLALELLASHHAPAAATAILVSSGLAGPGRPVVGLALGLAGLLIVVPIFARVPVPHWAGDPGDAGQ